MELQTVINMFNIEDIVTKKSNKPFKNGLFEDVVVEITVNLHHPRKVEAVLLRDSNTIVSTNMLKLKE